MKFAERLKWKTEIMSSSPSDLGGFKEVIVVIEGKDAFNALRYESGVHRVQRVPETEAQGRIHTSTITVAELRAGRNWRSPSIPTRYASTSSVPGAPAASM
jgi:peptide chain release factor 1